MIIEKIKFKLLMAKWQVLIDHPAVNGLFSRFFILVTGLGTWFFFLTSFRHNL